MLVMRSIVFGGESGSGKKQKKTKDDSVILYQVYLLYSVLYWLTRKSEYRFLMRRFLMTINLSHTGVKQSYMKESEEKIRWRRKDKTVSKG